MILFKKIGGYLSVGLVLELRVMIYFLNWRFFEYGFKV
jgi:hypothetical protein